MQEKPHDYEHDRNENRHVGEGEQPDSREDREQAEEPEQSRDCAL
ncbi:hypothetical protein [Halosegnis rubeus]|nr:hypothetical protein [Halosegnis rubeus]